MEKNQEREKLVSFYEELTEKIHDMGQKDWEDFVEKNKDKIFVDKKPDDKLQTKSPFAPFIYMNNTKTKEQFKKRADEIKEALHLELDVPKQNPLPIPANAPGNKCYESSGIAKIWNLFNKAWDLSENSGNKKVRNAFSDAFEEAVEAEDIQGTQAKTISNWLSSMKPKTFLCLDEETLNRLAKSSSDDLKEVIQSAADSEKIGSGNYSKGHHPEKYLDLLQQCWAFVENNGYDSILVLYSPSELLRGRVKRILLRDHNVILHGAPGTGKTYLAKKIAKDLIFPIADKNDSGEDGATPRDSKDGLENSEQFGFVQFHPSYDYTDFVEGLRPASGGKDGIEFELMPGTFMEFVDKARKDEKGNKYVFVIDEINRGDISKIFGELFFSVDPSYRGEKGSVKTQYSNLHEQSAYPFNEWFYIPENVYIVGTMNDIDRSVDTFDYAMRRRFKFIEVRAEDTQDMLDGGKNIKDAESRMDALNKVIDDEPELGPAYEIGGSYFMRYASGEESPEDLWEYSLGPLIKEYLRDIDKQDDFDKYESAYNNLKSGESSAGNSDGSKRDQPDQDEDQQ